MLCPYCGAVLARSDARCTRCHRPPPLDPHARHAAILASWQQGALDPAALQQAIAELTVTDARGQAWLPAPQAGQWLYWSGQEWLPYAGTAPLLQVAQATAPRRPVHWLVWVAGLGALAVIVLGGALALQTSERRIAARPGATVAALAPTGLPTARFTPRPTFTAPASGAAALTVLATSTPGLPKPTMTPISQVSLLAWDKDEPASAASFALIGGAATVKDAEYCLKPAGAEPALGTLDPKATDLSLQARVTVPDVDGASAGLLGCGVLFELNREGQWRQSLLGPDGRPTAGGAWLAAEGLGSYAKYDLGLTCESGATGQPGLLALVANGLIVTQTAPVAVATPLVGVYTSIPAGAAPEADACFDDWRLEVWPGAGTGHPADDRQPVLVELGQPDAFILEFEQEPEGGLYRIETWSYADVGMVFTFADAVLIETQGIDTESAEIVAWPVGYDPLAFTPDMTLEQVKALLTGQELASLDVPVEFGEGMVLYGGDQIVLGFTQGTLEFAETLPITAETPEQPAP